MAEWKQDEVGQWWQYTGKQKFRGEVATCQLCGQSFLRRAVRNGKYQGLYCSRTCANRADKPARFLRGEKHPNWKGGRSLHSSGYIVISYQQKAPGQTRWMLEHRYVMEQVLGRPLEAHETVHHKNGDKTDNRLENLELRVGKHGCHQRWTDLIAEIMRQPELMELTDNQHRSVQSAIERVLGLSPSWQNDG